MKDEYPWKVGATPNGFSMFDWPEQSQTSPTTTFSNLRALVPLTVISEGVLDALSGSRVTLHRPSAPAVQRLLWPLKPTTIFSPGAAEPPDRDGLVPLQYHVIAEDMRQTDFGMSSPGG